MASIFVATSSVGEGSCNGGNACRGASFSTASTLTVNDQSCNQYYACSYGGGKFSFQYRNNYNVVLYQPHFDFPLISIECYATKETLISVTIHVMECTRAWVLGV